MIRYSLLLIVAMLAVAIAATVGYFAHRERKKRWSEMPVGVGNAKARKRFVRENQAFLLEFRAIYSLLAETFIRHLSHPSEEAIEGLPDDDPAVIEFENKVIGNRLVFYLGRTAADDFSELLILAGNGYGVGALKILRGMYERIVTASYIAGKPSEARAFAEDDVIKKWKLWQEYSTVMPELTDRYSDEQKRDLEERYRAIRAKRKEETCSKCGQPKTQEAWTRVTMPDMAKRADLGLAELCGSCYLEPTFHSHATAYGVGTRLKETKEGGFTFNESTEAESERAVLLGHNLILRLLALQNQHFNLGLDEKIQQRIHEFPKVWDKGGDGP